VTGQQHAVLINQDRSRESDGADAVGDLTDLLLGMGAGVARMWLDLADRDRCDWTNLRLGSKSRVAPVRF
jgi:hypothetical protein